MSDLASLSPRLTPEKARMLSPLELAFVGDSVHALLVRTRLSGHDFRVHDMHLDAARAVSAVEQSRALLRLFPHLTAEEADIARRGRNAHAHHAAPKSASYREYAGATGLEALLGYLFLTGNMDRLLEIEKIMDSEDPENAKNRIEGDPRHPHPRP